jgi:hypothetical protein
VYAGNCSGSGSSGTVFVTFPSERLCSGSWPDIGVIQRCQLYGSVVWEPEFLVAGSCRTRGILMPRIYERSKTKTNSVKNRFEADALDVLFCPPVSSPTERSCKSRAMPDPPFHLVQNAKKTVEEAVFWHTASIVAQSGSQSGTATAIEWNCRSFLVTANHVVRKTTDSDLLFNFRLSGTLKRASEQAGLGPETLSPFPASPLRILQRFQDVADDIAALEVPSDLAEERNITFFRLPHSSRLPSQLPSTLAAIGFPANSVQDLSPTAKVIEAFAPWGNRIKPVKKPPRGYNNRTHILVDFPGAQEGRHPGGFSGAGAWYSESPPRSQVWMPNLSLAGIVTHYYADRGALLICRVERIATFLKRSVIGRTHAATANQPK